MKHKVIFLILLGCTSCTEVDNSAEEVKGLKIQVQEQYEYIKGLQNEIQYREGEISYWGHKYDSVVRVHKKK